MLAVNLNILKIVIPKRGFIARGICCFAAGSQQIPRRYNWLRNDQGWVLFLRKPHYRHDIPR